MNVFEALPTYLDETSKKLTNAYFVKNDPCLLKLSQRFFGFAEDFIYFNGKCLLLAEGNEIQFRDHFIYCIGNIFPLTNRFYHRFEYR